MPAGGGGFWTAIGQDLHEASTARRSSITRHRPTASMVERQLHSPSPTGRRSCGTHSTSAGPEVAKPSGWWIFVDLALHAFVAAGQRLRGAGRARRSAVPDVGAEVDGIDDDGLPPGPPSVRLQGGCEAIARCGARIDDLCFAAALGDYDAVRGTFDAKDASLRRRSADRSDRDARSWELRSDHEYALIEQRPTTARQVVDTSSPSNPDLSRARTLAYHATVSARRGTSTNPTRWSDY